MKTTFKHLSVSRWFYAAALCVLTALSTRSADAAAGVDFSDEPLVSSTSSVEFPGIPLKEIRGGKTMTVPDNGMYVEGATKTKASMVTLSSAPVTKSVTSLGSGTAIAAKPSVRQTHAEVGPAPVAVPEPSAVVLAALGLGGMLGLRRRR